MTRDDALVLPSAESLLQKTSTGDRDAFAQLYDVTVPRVFGLVRRLLVDSAQAEEVTQEVYLEVWQSAPRYDPGKGGAIAWMLTLAHRRAVDRIRSAQSARDRDLRIGARDWAEETDTVAETVETAIESEKVRRAMDRLTELQRQAITLAYFGGRTQSEISAHLKVPLGTVKTRLRDGMIRLRDELGVTDD